MRLWLKILLATGIVIVICLTVVGVLAGNVIRQRFDRFVRTQEYGALEPVALLLATYYRNTGSWAGVEQLLERRGRGIGAGRGARIILLDVNHRIVLDTVGETAGQTVSDPIWEAGVPIVVGGEEVGRLVSRARLNELQQRSQEEQVFLTSLGRILLGASLIGAVAAIVVATILAVQLAAPARELTRAARRVAAGDLDHRVTIRSHDELAEVGHAFNDMAASLSRQEDLRRHMVADIAHELRTPLSVMQVELESLQDGLAEPSPETITSLQEEVQLLSRLVEDLRLLSLMDAGQLPLQRQAVALGVAIRDVLQKTAATAKRRGLVLEAEVPPTLPPVHADPDRLQQILLNLVSNAIRHTPAGGRVHLSAHPEADQVHLRVTDTGEGIAPGDLPHIFERFYRADASRSRATGGSGLGLTIAQGLVEAMGGQIWAESTLGEGTTIHVTLPQEP